jgi:hypothetical protein
VFAGLPIAPSPMKPHIDSRAVEVENSRVVVEEAEAARHTAEPTITLLIFAAVAWVGSSCSTFLGLIMFSRSFCCGQCSPEMGADAPPLFCSLHTGVYFRIPALSRRPNLANFELCPREPVWDSDDIPSPSLPLSLLTSVSRNDLMEPDLYQDANPPPRRLHQDEERPCHRRVPAPHGTLDH